MALAFVTPLYSGTCLDLGENPTNLVWNSTTFKVSWSYALAFNMSYANPFYNVPGPATAELKKLEECVHKAGILEAVIDATKSPINAGLALAYSCVMAACHTLKRYGAAQSAAITESRYDREYIFACGVLLLNGVCIRVCEWSQFPVRRFRLS